MGRKTRVTTQIRSKKLPHYAYNGAHRRGLIGRNCGQSRTPVPTDLRSWSRTVGDACPYGFTILTADSRGRLSLQCYIFRLFFPNTIRLPSPPCQGILHQPIPLFADKRSYSSVRDITRVFYHKNCVLSIFFSNLYFFYFSR